VRPGYRQAKATKRGGTGDGESERLGCTADAGGTDPRDPAEGRRCRAMRPLEGTMPGTPGPDPISTRQERIATQGRGREVTGEVMVGRAGCLNSACPDLWGAGVGNRPGLPDRGDRGSVSTPRSSNRAGAVSRIWLSDKKSHLRPRKVSRAVAQTDEAKFVMKPRVGESCRSAALQLVLPSKPLAEPMPRRGGQQLGRPDSLVPDSGCVHSCQGGCDVGCRGSCSGDCYGIAR